MQKNIGFLLIGAVVGLIFGFVAFSSKHPNPAPENEAAKIATGSVDRQAFQGLNKCFFDEEQRDVPVFRLEGRQYFFSELALADQTIFVQGTQNALQQQKTHLDRVAARMLMAKEAGKAVNLDRVPEVQDLVVEDIAVSDDEIEAFYSKNKALFAGTASPDDQKKTIAKQLRGRKVAQVVSKYRQKLTSSVYAYDHFQTCHPTLTFPTEGLLTIGASAAPLEITMFGDFRCQQCRRLWPKLASALAANPADLRILPILRNLDDKASALLTKGVFCAAEQDVGKTTGFLSSAYRIPLGTLAKPERVESYMAERIIPDVKLDKEMFTACVNGGDASKYVETLRRLTKEMALGTRVMLLANRRPLLPAPDEEQVVNVLRQLLEATSPDSTL